MLQSLEQVSCEALKINRPQHERDEQPVVNAPDDAGFGFSRAVNFPGQGMKPFQQGAAMFQPAKGHAAEALQITA